LAIGDQGCIVTIRPHEPALPYHPFIAYDDIALGVHITSLAERWKHMRPQYEGDELIRGKLEYREKMRPGDLSARRDRIEQQKREARR
jgi:hypothetical protein